MYKGKQKKYYTLVHKSRRAGFIAHTLCTTDFSQSRKSKSIILNSHIEIFSELLEIRIHFGASYAWRSILEARVNRGLEAQLV